MSVAAPSLRDIPAARGSVLERVAVHALECALRDLQGGSLDVALPDGTARRFGAGPSVAMDIWSPRLFRRLATRGALGLGESYQAGEWSADDLAGVLELFFRNAGLAATRHPWLARLISLRPRPRTRQDIRRAKRHIGYHYDLGNDFFALMLDETMTYSCAIFEPPDEPLANAQRRKLRRVCEKLHLGPDDHLLEIGCGWGSLAITAASEYGARVTGLTISAAQARLARERMRAAGLESRVEIVEEDYRAHRGVYSKIASIEMIEAIGATQFSTFFASCDRLLGPDGRACVQTILIPDDRWERYRRSPDWIERYVFPGCLIPSLSALLGAMARASCLTLESREEIGPHYAETLSRWRQTFHERIDDVRALGYDEHFKRTWDFYLASCEAGFRSRALRDTQLVFVR